MNQTFWVLAASILASSMAFIDSSALNVAIPSIQKEFNASGSDILWLLNGYLLMLAAFILPGGALGDKLGRKKIFMVGIGLFLISSLTCGLAWNSQALIVARFLQGLGGALMIPGSLSLINASVTAQDRGKAIGTWSAATTLVTVSGPVLGGFLADLHFWRGIFLINIPLGIVALIILMFKVPESRNEENIGPIDYWGALLLAAGLGALSYGVLRIPDVGLQTLEAGGAILSGVGILAIFFWHEAKSKSPMLPLHLFQSARFTGSNLLTFFLYGALSVGLFFLSLNLIQAQGYSQTLAGFATIPFGILLTLLSRKMGSLADRYGPRWFLVLGPTLVGLAFLLLSLPGSTHGPSDYWRAFFPGIFTFGLGMAITVAPLTTTVLAAAGQQYSGTASGINNAISRIAGSLAIAAIGAMALSSFQHNLEKETALLAIPEPARQTLRLESNKLADASPPSELPAPLRHDIQQAIQDSFIKTYQLMMLICASLSGISALLAFILIQNPSGRAVEPKSD